MTFRVVGVIALLLTAAVPAASAYEPIGAIAFASTRGCPQDPAPGSSDLYLMNTDGTNVRRLTDSCLENGPTWSPDGTQLAFASKRDGYSAVYVMNADGSGAHRVTPVGLWAEGPAWSRGGILAFSTAVGDIDTIQPDGSQLTTVASTGRGRDPSWSADGSKIAYSYDDRTTNYVDTIAIVEATGANWHQLAPGATPAYSPDGLHLAWASRDSTGAAALVVANADGSGAHPIVTIPTGAVFSYDLDPAWSPDSTTITYDAGPNAEIYAVPAAGGTATRLTVSAAAETRSSWRPVTPSAGLLIAKVSFRQRACATRPGTASVLVVDGQGRSLSGVTVTAPGATARTDAAGTASLRPTVAKSHRGRLAFSIRAALTGRPVATKRVSLPACVRHG